MQDPWRKCNYDIIVVVNPQGRSMSGVVCVNCRILLKWITEERSVICTAFN